MKKNTYTDKELVLQLQNGNEQAFDLLYERYYRLVYFIANELCRNDADAKDISQEVFLQIQKSIQALQEPERLKQWINRITINKCKNLFRKHIDLPVEEDVLFQKQLREDRFYMLPEKQVHFKSDQEMIQYFIQHLSYECHEVILLRYYENMSMSEMADILDIPEGTVKSRLRKAKAELKKMISTYEKTYDVPLNFHVSDQVLGAAFAYSYAKTTSSLLPSIYKGKHLNIASMLPAVSAKLLIASLACVGVSGAYVLYQSQQEEQPSTLPVHEAYKATDSLAKQYYFQLKDWACCRDDMERKSKEEFEEMKTVYQALKSTSSPYYQRLVDDQWTTDFEELEKQLQIQG